MSIDQIVYTIKNKKSDLNDHYVATLLIKQRIEYCVTHNINMSKDPLLSKVLLFT